MALTVGTNPLELGAVRDVLAAAFADELYDLRLRGGSTVVARCAAADLTSVARRLKAHDEIGYETLNFIAGVDRGAHLESVYHLYSWKTNTSLELHVEVLREEPELDTVTAIWPAADWHERESWDLLGIRYRGHPDPRRILLPDGFIGHPLRKDYVDCIENHPHA